MSAIRYICLASAVIVGVVIVFFSLKPGLTTPVSDKIVHLVAYCSWTFLALMAPRTWWPMIVLAVAIFWISATVEGLQPFFGRSASWKDLLANGVGVFIGVNAAIVARLSLEAMLGREPETS